MATVDAFLSTAMGEGDGSMFWDDGTSTKGAHTTAKAAAAAGHGARKFSAPDYVVFFVALGVPLAIGIFFFLVSLRKPSTEEFLMGSRKMNFIVVGLSIVASLLNGVFVIGQPAEIHYFGIRIVYNYLGLVIAVVAVSHVWVAKYQTMVFTSAYQYVEERYNLATRMVASLIFIVSVTVFLAVVLFVPAQAFAEVTNLSIYPTIVITGIVCTVYTTIGGLKAVVWTDAIQMLILLGGLIAIAVIGAAKAGGGQQVWEIAKKTGRNNFVNFNFDPRERTSFWPQTVGSGVVFLGLFISNQMMVQRYMAVPTSAKAQGSLYSAMLMTLPLYVLIAIIGLVMHARYAACDPLVSKLIDSADKIVPFYIMDILGDYRGLPGLIMSSIFAAALSSVSSVINALSAVVLEDFVDPIFMMRRKRKLSDKTRRWIAIVIVIIFGIITIGLSFAADRFTQKLVQATGVIWGVLGGPLMGIFIMGFLMPFVNSWGAISGMIVGLVISLWIAIGSVMHARSPQTLPIGACVPNITYLVTVTTPKPHNDLKDWYEISFMWFGTIGAGVCIIVGMVVSLFTYGFSYEYRSTRDPSLMFSVSDKCCCCCPMACIKCYRCGVKYDEEEKLELKRIEKFEPNGHTAHIEVPDLPANGKQNQAYAEDRYDDGTRNQYPTHDGRQNPAYTADRIDDDYLQHNQYPADVHHNHHERQNGAYAMDGEHM